MELKKKSNFIKQNKIPLIIFVIAVIGGYVGIYLAFRGDGFISVGKDLTKSDWLSFLGAYLSFVGTVAVSLIALFQSNYYTKIENERRLQEHRKKIQPIFSVNIISMNTQIEGTGEFFNPSDPSTYPKHNNIKISIENVNSYPINHVIVFDKYICPLLKCNESKSLGTALTGVWNGVPALFRGVPMSVAILKAGLSRNLQAAWTAQTGLSQTDNGKTEATSRRQAILSSLIGRAMEKPTMLVL